MRNRKFLIFLLLLSLGGCTAVKKPDLNRWNSLSELGPFKKNERVLILAPHPDDEAIACAGVIQKALAAGAKVKVAYLTNGDHNELAFIVYEKRITVRQGEFIHMGQVRQKEAIKAMKSLGLSENDLVFLGYPDFGTFEIFCNYWRSQRPFRDRLTRISYVPYKNNPSYGAPYYGESILNDLVSQILDYKPDKIFVSHPADVNVDHKALYLFLQVALSDLETKILKPRVYPYLVHCLGWPKPSYYHPELELYPPHKFIGSKINWQRLDLSLKELDKKYQAILFYKSQTQSSAFYLLSFARKNELFGDYPFLELTPRARSKDKPVAYPDTLKTFGMTQPAQDSEESDAAEDRGLVSYAQENNNFILRVDTPKQLSSRFGVMLYIFGYAKNTAFARMPKIRIITAGKKFKVFSAEDKVVNSGVILNLGKNYLILRVPLKLLGEPDYLLTSLKVYHGNLSVNAIGYRKIKIK
ncbi:MAG: PIG-L family deacetylase [Candidatus Omnitrophica bacterium]|nr:PIG-L family deacetylase [Candidatus Omnitrophota bacterium]